MSDKIGKVVKTAQGVGTIISYRDEDQMFVITLNDWTLSEGQKVTVYAQESQLTFEDVKAEEAPAEAVVAAVEEKSEETPVEPQQEDKKPEEETKVEEVVEEKQDDVAADEKKDEVAPEVVVAEAKEQVEEKIEKQEEVVADVAQDAVVVVEQEQKTEDSPVTEEAAAVKVEDAPVTEQTLVGKVVKTPYGIGNIVDFRSEDDIYKVQLTNWVLTNDQAVFLFARVSQFTIQEEAKKEEVATTSEAVAEEKKEEATAEVEVAVVAEEQKKDDEINTLVKTAYGEATIVEYREEDKMYKLQLTNWVLTNDQAVFVYCQRDAFETTQKDFDAKVDTKIKETKEGKNSGGCCNIM